MKPPLLSIQQVMERLSVGYSTVYTLIKSGKLKAAKIGGWRVDPDDLEQFIALEKSAAHGPTVAAAVQATFDADLNLPEIENPFR